MKNKILELIDNEIYGFQKAEILQVTWGGSDKIPISKMIEQFKKLRSEIEKMQEEPHWMPVTESTKNIKCLFTDGYEYGVGYKFRTDYTGISFVPTHFIHLPPNP